MHISIKIVLSILLLITLFIAIFEYIEYHIKYYLRNAIIIKDNITADLLNKVIDNIYLIHTSIYPMFNSKYSSHWSIVVSIKDDFDITRYIYITSTRYNGILLYEAILTKDNKFFIKEDSYYLNIMQKYEPITFITVYDLSTDFLKFINTDNYKPFSHSCQHSTSYIIKKYVKDYNINDINTLSTKHILSDVIIGPKIYI